MFLLRLKNAFIQHTFTLKKDQRLKSRKKIQTLFEKGKAWNQPPLRIICANLESEFPLQAGFSVSKKKFRRAVDRNRVKRLMREAWRLNSIPLKTELSDLKKSLSVFLIYTGHVLPEYRLIEEKVKEVIEKLMKMNESS